VPVTVTVNVPLLVEEGTVIVSVEEPEPVIDDGLNVADNPPPDALPVRETVPVNPFRDAIVTLEVLCDPLLMLRLVGDADMEKSGLVTVTGMVIV
jgi:hypothetical protein